MPPPAASANVADVRDDVGIIAGAADQSVRAARAPVIEGVRAGTAGNDIAKRVTLTNEVSCPSVCQVLHVVTQRVACQGLYGQYRCRRQRPR